MYGRFLYPMVPSIVLILCGRSLRLALVATAALFVTWFRLLISFSQSSFASLLVVVIAPAFVAWRWRALVAVVLAARGARRHLGRAAADSPIASSTTCRTDSNDVTSGRFEPRRERIRIAWHLRCRCRRRRVQARIR